jgi:TIR domain-containing protein
VGHGGKKDFFVSYRSADEAWASWIAWQLEEAGYTTFFQGWDFRPGQNFVNRMQEGTTRSDRTLVVISPAYFQSDFTQAEWYAAFKRDPAGQAGTLLPVKVESCDLEGLLGPIVHIDLVGVDEEEARHRLLEGVAQTRAKPSTAPPFPLSKPEFPGPKPVSKGLEDSAQPSYPFASRAAAKLNGSVPFRQAYTRRVSVSRLRPH